MSIILIAHSAQKATSQNRVQFNGQWVEYWLRLSRTAKRISLRVGPAGVEMVQPVGRATNDAVAFLHASTEWVLAELERVRRLAAIYRPVSSPPGSVLYNGRSTPVRVESQLGKQGPNQLQYNAETGFVVVRGPQAQVAAAATLEAWMYRQAIEQQLMEVLPLVRREAASAPTGAAARRGATSPLQAPSGRGVRYALSGGT